LTDKTNLILNNYNSTSSNHAIYVDETSLGAYGTLLLAQDSASRCIICHCYDSDSLSSHLVVETISEALRKRSFLPPILIIHSDRGTLFKNEVVASFLAEKGITHSRGSAEGHHNQVVERLNRSFKDILKTFLDKDWRRNKTNPLNHQNLSLSDFSDLVTKSIEFYNNRSHRSLQNSSPNEMEEALFKAHQGNHPDSLPLYTSDSLIYQDFQTKVLKDYHGDWERFFLEWREKSDYQHDIVVTAVKEKAAEAKARAAEAQVRAEALAAEAREQYETLYAKYHQIQKDLEMVLAESLLVKEARESREARKQAHKGRKKAPIREVISKEDLTLILSLVGGRSPFQISRRRLGLTLLYLTGLRVSNLLVLTIQNVRDLFFEGKIKIRLIKGGAPRFDLIISSADRKRLVKLHQVDLANLGIGKGKDPSGLIFTNQENVPLSRVYLDTELNFILQKASVLLHKHIRTHSFRASYVTDWLEVHDIPVVQKLIGHRSISSTNEYNRGHLSIAKRTQLLKDRPDSSKRPPVGE